MPYDDPDPTDPMTLHGVMVETEDPQAMTAMAECFIEEFARMDFEPERIYRLFLNPGYAGPFMAHNALGDERIRTAIDDYFALRGRPAPTWRENGRAFKRAFAQAEACGSGFGRKIELPVLES